MIHYNSDMAGRARRAGKSLATRIVMKKLKWGVVKAFLLKAMLPFLAVLLVIAVITVILVAIDQANRQAGACTTVNGGQYQPNTEGVNMSAAVDAYKVAVEMNASDTVLLAMFATGFPESGWRNLASNAVPESKGFPNDGAAPGDADSVGIFQQRAGWGSVAERMQPAYQAKRFIEEAQKIEGQHQGNPGELAASVQRPAAQYRYKYGTPENLAAAQDLLNKARDASGVAPAAPAAPGADPAAAAATPVSVGACGSAGGGTFQVGSTVVLHKYGGAEGPQYTIAIPTGPAGVAVSAALSQLGVPYSWGGGDPGGPTNGVGSGAGTVGFDCSGLTEYAYAAAGIQIGPTTSTQQPKLQAAGAAVSESQKVPGDLIFWTGHVAMYLGSSGTEQIMIEAPQTGDRVKISPLRSGGTWMRPTVMAGPQPGQVVNPAA